MAATRTRSTGTAVLALLASLSLGLTACTDGGMATSDDDANSIGASVASSIDEAIGSAIALSGSDSAIVGIWSSSGDYVRGYGEGITGGSPIRAAQASQPVMCALLLELSKSGELSLDRELAEDLPRQLGIEGITYGMLCDATSGLADFKATISDIFANNPTRPWSDRELLAHSLAHSPLSAPGAAQHVSDTDSMLLARALRQATGERVDTLLQEHVFNPAEMHSSYYPADLATAVALPGGGMNGFTYPMSGGAPVCTVTAPVAGGEEGAVETLPIEPNLIEQVSPSMLSGAGATVTTVTDLKRFYERYLAGGFGAAGSADLITSLWVAPPPEPPADGETAEQPPAEETTEGEEAAPPTEGWTFGLEKRGSLFGMSGRMTGTLTAAYHDPASSFTVVVAVNNSSAGAEFVRALAFQLAAISGANVEWAAEDQAARLAELAVCQPPAETPEEEPPAE